MPKFAAFSYLVVNARKYPAVFNSESSVSVFAVAPRQTLTATLPDQGTTGQVGELLYTWKTISLHELTIRNIHAPPLFSPLRSLTADGFIPCTVWCDPSCNYVASC